MALRHSCAINMPGLARSHITAVPSSSPAIISEAGGSSGFKPISAKLNTSRSSRNGKATSCAPRKLSATSAQCIVSALCGATKLLRAGAGVGMRRADGGIGGGVAGGSGVCCGAGGLVKLFCCKRCSHVVQPPKLAAAISTNKNVVIEKSPMRYVDRYIIFIIHPKNTRHRLNAASASWAISRGYGLEYVLVRGSV